MVGKLGLIAIFMMFYTINVTVDSNDSSSGGKTIPVSLIFRPFLSCLDIASLSICKAKWKTFLTIQLKKSWFHFQNHYVSQLAFSLTGLIKSVKLDMFFFCFFF